MAAASTLSLEKKTLAELGADELLRFPGSLDEYWDLAVQPEYRVDYQNGEIIAGMSYESAIHSDLVSELMYMLRQIFSKEDYRFGNSNRPIAIPACGHAIFNPDGSVLNKGGAIYEYRPGMNAELEPILVFEVLSKTTRARDWGEKLVCYKKIPTVQHILYVDSEALEVHLFKRVEGAAQWLETIYTEREAVLELSDKAIPLAAIYEGTLEG
ncbi:MAG TPA: Uma2 family endonuclease [Saprospiraceae bacterium]|nr:Uma2 family endonuclease [Saprospiraceae bacterium]HMQ84314.1 Uma2 family endonuclease [Saprospiraceae bacterium]